MVGGHAQRGVALGVLDAFVAFARSQLHVGDFHVVLIVQPGLHAQLDVCLCGHQPHRFHLRFRLGLALGSRHGFRREARRLSCLGTSRCRVFQQRAQAELAVRGTGRNHKALTVVAQRRTGGIGAEVGVFLVPDQLAAAVGPQVHHRRPAAGHGNRVCFHFLTGTAFAVLGADGDLGHAFAVLHLGDGAAQLDPDALFADRFHQRAAAGFAGVDHADHFDACVMQHQRGAVSVVVVGGNHDLLTRGDTPVHHIVAHRAGQHHARHIVARKGQRTLDGTGCGDDLASPDPPKTMARAALARRVVGQALIAQGIAVVIDSGTHAAVAQGDVVHRLQLSQSLLDPDLGCLAVDGAAVDRRAAAPVVVLLHHQNLGARRRSRLGCLQAGNAAADDQHVREEVEVLVGVGVLQFLVGRGAQTGGLPDDRLIDVLPQRTRVDEHLVIEAGGQEPAELVVDRQDVELQARPMVLRLRGQPREQLGGGGALVRLIAVAHTQLHQRIGFLGARRHHAARAVVLERAAHHHLAVGQQGGCERIAGKALHALAVKGEVDLFGAVDQPAVLGKTRAHGRRPFKRKAGVSVRRRIISGRPQIRARSSPGVWQRSCP